jgi:hypothetical protein
MVMPAGESTERAELEQHLAEFEAALKDKE